LFKFRVKRFWSHDKFFCEKFMKVWMVLSSKYS
jgi:hypothetical protein